MPHFSEQSKKRLSTCHPWLQDLCNEAIKIYDFTVLCGHRDELAQMIAFQEGKSKLDWPKSKHNKTPSLAVDLAPYPIDWNDIDRFYHLAGIMKGLNHKMRRLRLTWGGDWYSFKDYPHFEIKEKE